MLLDGTPVKSCTMLAVQADGRVAHDRRRAEATTACTAIQAAFKEAHGLQCGFCTPGMMLVGVALLEENPDPTDDDVRWAISGNICRCTGYMNIVKAIRAAAAAARSTDRADGRGARHDHCTHEAHDHRPRSAASATR